jgi:hypothetical protein
MNIKSTTGRSPQTAAPTPRPMMAPSAIGVGAEFLTQPPERAEHAPDAPDVLAGDEDHRVFSHQLGEGFGHCRPVGQLAPGVVVAHGAATV